MAQTQSLPPPFGQSAYGGAPQYEHKAQNPNAGAIQANGQALQQQMPRTSQAASPQVFSGTRDHWQFSLQVEQQPVRARMCGFGDKDRRPITPPPCVRLVIIDTRTLKEVPADQVDASFFVLQVDLWDESGAHETNVVRAASNSPATSISTATTTSYPPPPDRQPVYAPPAMATRDPYTGGLVYHQPPPHYPPHPMYQQSAPVPSMYAPPPPPPGYYAQPMTPYSPYHPQQSVPAPLAFQPQYHAVMQPQPPQSGMFTRNLIGSLSVNAFQLRDPKGKEGHWFVLQDLSVRTEGNFRLKMNFIDVGSQIDGRNTLNQGKCPVLASAFSQPFQVFSAKKFPGVIESTELSKTFAGQGIKIPIRKDGGKNEAKDEDDD